MTDCGCCRYQFDVSRLGEHHELNQKRGKLVAIYTITIDCLHRIAKEAMHRGISPIIIDNTNTKCHEMKPYVAAVSSLYLVF